MMIQEEQFIVMKILLDIVRTFETVKEFQVLYQEGFNFEEHTITI